MNPAFPTAHGSHDTGSGSCHSRPFSQDISGLRDSTQGSVSGGSTPREGLSASLGVGQVFC